MFTPKRYNSNSHDLVDYFHARDYSSNDYGFWSRRHLVRLVLHGHLARFLLSFNPQLLSSYLIFAGMIGSLAAAFQSWMYGGFTPAAGVFATLTSVGMLGFATPIFTAVAVLIATLVAVITWLCVRG